MEYRAHVYRSLQLESLLEDMIRFFRQSPLAPLGNICEATFTGVGAYALYYAGDLPVYAGHPADRSIYVGKAAPRGWRHGRQLKEIGPNLYLRLCEHARSIEATSDLRVDDFMCRFVILEDAAIDLVAALESALIRLFLPLWNSVVDGFGIHHPGSGRYGQAPSEWDTLHPGRTWLKHLTGQARQRAEIIAKIREHIAQLGV